MADGIQKKKIYKKKRATANSYARNTLPLSLYIILKESECKCPKNCPKMIVEYFRTNRRYRKLFFSEKVV